MKLFLLDAYALIYRSYYAFIKNPRINSKGVNTGAIFGFLNTLDELLKKENPTHIAVVFDPPGGSFRNELYEAYKANRESTPEDIRVAVPYIKRIVEAYGIPILEVLKFEADDVIGTIAIAASHIENREFEIYMMTPDKDYGQLVRDGIYIYKPKYGSNECEVLDIEAVKAKFDIDSPEQVIDLLGLMGDSADNIPGCPGVGEKTAVKLLKEFGSIENLIANTSQLKGALKTKVEENVEMIRFSRELATIKVDVPLDFIKTDESGRVELDIAPLIKNEVDEKALVEVYRELEFRSKLTSIFGASSGSTEGKRVKTVKKDMSQLSLFGEETTDAPETSLLSEEMEDAENHNYLSSAKTVDHTYKLVETKEDIIAIIEEINTRKSFCFDTETTSLNIQEADLVGVAIAIEPHKAYYIPAALFLENKELFTPFADANIEKVGQNIKYDMNILTNYDIEVNGKLFDTMIAHYLLQPESRHSMDFLAQILLNYETIHIEELIGPKGKNQLSMKDVPLDQIAEYSCEDADVTLQLKNILENQLKEANIYSLFSEIEMPLTKVLANIECNGVRIDSEALSISSVELTKILNEIEQEVKTLAGVSDININSAKQIGELLFDTLKIVEKARKTKTGQYQTDEETLRAFVGKHPIVEKILTYRGVKKLLSTYIDALPLLVSPKTGKIHTSFNQTVVATGRLSSSNPNLQNIPIRDEMGKEIRKAFVPNDGEQFLSADYSQIELRIMAHLSQDPALVAAFHSDQDVHSATAAKIFNVAIEEVTSDMRRKAKTANFGIIYGISAFGLSERLGISRFDAKALIDGYFEAFPKVKDYMDSAIEEAREKGYVETLLGRKRFLPDINSKNGNVRGFAERNAINAPIQGTAADIIKIAMIKIDQRFRELNLKSQMILQVHDELNFSVAPQELEIVKQLVKEEMESAISLSVPLKVDMGIGKNWLESH